MVKNRCRVFKALWPIVVVLGSGWSICVAEDLSKTPLPDGVSCSGEAAAVPAAVVCFLEGRAVDAAPGRLRDHQPLRGRVSAACAGGKRARLSARPADKMEDGREAGHPTAIHDLQQLGRPVKSFKESSGRISATVCVSTVGRKRCGKGQAIRPEGRGYGCAFITLIKRTAAARASVQQARSGPGAESSRPVAGSSHPLPRNRLHGTAKACILLLHDRRPGAAGNLRPQARRPRRHARRVQADRDQRPRHPDLRTPADDGEADAPLRDLPFASGTARTRTASASITT